MANQTRSFCYCGEGISGTLIVECVLLTNVRSLRETTEFVVKQWDLMYSETGMEKCRAESEDIADSFYNYDRPNI